MCPLSGEEVEVLAPGADLEGDAARLVSAVQQPAVLPAWRAIHSCVGCVATASLLIDVVQFATNCWISLW